MYKLRTARCVVFVLVYSFNLFFSVELGMFMLCFTTYMCTYVYVYALLYNILDVLCMH